MRHSFQLIVSLLCLFGLCSCDGTSFQNPVPVYPVHVVVDTRGLFVHFMETNQNAYITVDKNGYFENDVFVKSSDVTDAWGYGGVVVYVSMLGYVAYDLACPYCAGQSRKSPCYMDGIYAVCPHCGEQYELGSGYALPQKGISKYALRQLNIIQSDGKLTITQRQ